MNKKKVYRKCGKKYDYYYQHYCEQCNKDRGFLAHKNPPKLCKSCAGFISHSNISDETKIKMSIAKTGRTPWNKDKTGIYSEEAKKSMGSKWLGKEAHNKNKVMSEEQKIKLSCVNRGISLEEFDDFTTEQSKRERNKFSMSGLREECFKSADYTCQICKTRGVTLNAHHIKSWKDYPEERYSLNNLQCLCETCHKDIHK